MFQKLFALAGMTAVTGLVFALAIGGCSSSETGATPATEAGAPTDASADVKPDRIIDPTGDAAAACGPTGDAVTSAQIDQEIGWKPPTASSDCSVEDLAAIKKVIDAKTAKTFNDFVATASAECKACVVTAKDATNWGPIVTFNADATQGIVNWGACYAVADSPTCGKAIEYAELCLTSTCSDCTEDADNQACLKASAASQCKAIVAEVQTACTKKEADAACAGLIDNITVVCGGGGADGGT